ncbi:MAG: DNA-processing protein DprA, partial [Kiloniellales bacterium]
LGQRGFVVVSGLARGIDAASHQGALDSGTLAANAGGVEVAYPPENAGIHHDICQRGLVLSEMPLGLQPQARHFPRRNRLVSGLSLGVVVIEAARRSGSAITARFAGEQGREVMAVPGSPLDPRAQGCNALIRSGATLVESAADIEEALSGLETRGLAEPGGAPFEPGRSPRIPGDSELGEARTALADLLSPSPVAVDELIRQCQLSPAVVHLVLLEMELAGRLERHPGGRVGLIAGA